MKKIIALLLVAATVLMAAACKQEPEVEKKGEGVMTYEEFAKAALDSEVTIEAYVQGKQSWWNNKGTFYTQDKTGGYFLYEMPCTKEEYDKLTVGTKIRVKGTKAEWGGEVEIIDTTFEILDGNYVAKAEDVTSLVGTDKLIEKMNKLVVFKGLTVVAQSNGEAFNYKNEAEKTDDLYFKATLGDGKDVSFCVEFYLTGKDTDVYKAVENLKVGDKIDVEAFLYWYNGANPHAVKVTPSK